MDKHKTSHAGSNAEPTSSEEAGDAAPARGSESGGDQNAEARGSADGDEGRSTAADSTSSSSDTGTAGALQAEREKYLRLAAEFDNYRKRNVRERQEAGWRAQSDLVVGLVEALDDIMRFAHLDPATVDCDTVVQGVALVEKKMLKTLGGHGLEVLNPVDQPFDPAFHEAVGTEPALSREDDHLIGKVYQAGYLFRGQLLRPARVVVKQWLG